jgi:hypothetical protein
VREFAGTVMVDGTVAMEVLLLERLTTNPPLAAAEDNVTVPSAKRGLFTKERSKVSDATVTGGGGGFLTVQMGPPLPA